MKKPENIIATLMIQIQMCGKLNQLDKMKLANLESIESIWNMLDALRKTHVIQILLYLTLGVQNLYPSKTVLIKHWKEITNMLG